MTFTATHTILYHGFTASDGKEYVRFAAENWAVWMAESLEIINNEQRIVELETAYAVFLSDLPLPTDPRT